MTTGKATKGQIRRHNRELVLRAIYTQTAANRAALAQETGLTKPAVSDLVSELIDEGLLVEEGFGESTDSGGKRPRLLRFLPEARQVIGLSLHKQQILGLLTYLDGSIVVEHQADLTSTQPSEVFEVLVEVINGLIAQRSAPLMCLSVGISAVVDDLKGVVLHAPRFGWFNVPLADRLRKHFSIPVYVSNNTELATRAQIAFGRIQGTEHLATILIGNSVGVGYAHTATHHHAGNDIGHLVLHPGQEGTPEYTIEQVLGWHAVKDRAFHLGDQYRSPYLCNPALSYVDIRFAAAYGDQAALILQDELSTYVAQVYAWVITLLRTDHVALAGPMANMGEKFLERVVHKTGTLVVKDLMDRIGFSLDETDNLVALGAVAKALQNELGLIY